MKNLLLTNSSANQVHELLKPSSGFGSISSLCLTNSESSGAVAISLYIEVPSSIGKSLETFYILRNTVIPEGAALLLDQAPITSFDNTKFGLYLSIEGNSDTVSVMIL